MATQVETSRQFLDAVYRDLGYDNGVLLDAIAFPESTDASTVETWTDKGGWLAIAEQIGAEKIFFVDNDPVIVFHEALDDDPQHLKEIFNQAWCMARPPLLFIAFPGGLEVYSLNQPPARDLEEWNDIKPLEVVRRTKEVSKILQAYKREQVETRQILGKEDLGTLEQRADRRLILDLKEVRKQLLAVDPSVNPKHIHALIGRSIFIRYLEDREILSPDYFRKVTENSSHPAWLELLEKPVDNLFGNADKRMYVRVLEDKDFTYALFNQLAEHFNGDMFPRDSEEETAITAEHLNLLRGFLLGDVDKYQRKLFLWAYDFNIIPLELISSIYEEFYHTSDQKDTGTHYTPSVLVEYVLSQVLTPPRLAQNPRILDFACGSAIFLVQAYRRIVRYKESLLGRELTNQELRQILRDQIAGIEINAEAIRVAAFSLYLALLHYQKPADILKQIEQANGEKPLPHLILDTDHPQARDVTHYNILYRGNAFDLMDCEKSLIKQKLDEIRRFSGRVEWDKLYAAKSALPFTPHSFDVIVGNPPWGYAKESEDSLELHLAQEHALRWCDVFDWSVGDKELSQAFIARSLSLLTENGVCGLLVSAGVFLKRGDKSVKLRKRWLENSTIEILTNFIHVRDVFFSGANSPFCFVQYHNYPPSPDHRVRYWSAKRTETVTNAQSVVLTLHDLHKVRQWELVNHDALWKVYWWGNHRDAILTNTLGIEDTLEVLVERKKWSKGQGYTPGSLYPSDREIFAFTWEFRERLLSASVPVQVIDQVESLYRNEYKGRNAAAQALYDLEKTLSEQAQVYAPQILQQLNFHLTDYDELCNFNRYGTLDNTCFAKVPPMVHRYGVFGVYSGWRLLVERGITQANDVNGCIIARIEKAPFCFGNSVHAVNLEMAEDWERKVLLAILWSSITRYFFFMTTSSWGPWHHEIHLEDGLLRLPIRFPDKQDLRERIIRIVDELRAWNPQEQNLFTPDGLPLDQIQTRQAALERQLDEAIFDLYELNEPERDLILDLCETGLEFFYREEKSIAVQRIAQIPQSVGTMADLPGARDEETGLQGYLYAFLQMWNPQLETIGGEFNWRIIRPPAAPMLAVVFTTQYKGAPLSDARDPNDERAWQELLKELSETSRYPVSERIYIDGLFRIVTDTNVIIIKRDERRLWTRSLAREDAEATLVQATYRQKELGK